MPVGIDVSYAQGKPDWDAVKASGRIDFVYVKASEGFATRGPDPQFKHNWSELNRVEIKKGAYHFYRPGLNPVTQAEKFFSIVGPLNYDDLPPCIDVEIARDHATSGRIFAEGVRDFIEKAEQLFGRRLVIYTSGPIFEFEMQGADECDHEFFSERELWLAAYVSDPNKFVPSMWKKRGKSWSIWQKSGDICANGSTGVHDIPGINAVVDYNVTQMAADDLMTWIDASRIITPSAPYVPLPSKTPDMINVDIDTSAFPVRQPETPTVTQDALVQVDDGSPVGLWGIIMAIFKFFAQLFNRG